MKGVDKSLTIDEETVSCFGEGVGGEGTDKLVEFLVGVFPVRGVCEV